MSKNMKLKIRMKRMKQDAKAISPIVATLMLVLITVAAAFAFFTWESGWQASTTKGIGNNDIGNTTQSSLDISGSTTVNPFVQLAAPAYMAANPNVKISIDAIGSGSGLNALEAGQANMAMISDTITATQSTALANYPSLQGVTIAYDGVVMFVGVNTLSYHGMKAANFNITATDARAIYGSVLAGVTVAPTIHNWWDLENATFAHHGAGEVAVTDANHFDKLNVYYRADSSGTSDAFAEKYINEKGYLSSSNFAALSSSSTAPVFKGATGNTGMISSVDADSDGIGFTSYGMVSTSGGKAVATNYEKDFATTGNPAQTTFVTPSSASILAGVKGTGTAATQYGCVRPLILVTMGTPSAVAQDFINWCLNSGNNAAYCSATGYISIYS